jgi:hypothetical protein
MTIHRPNDFVKLNPAILEDKTLKRNHHLLSRILREEKIGVIQAQDMEKSTPQAFFYWVSFHYASFLLSEFHLMKLAVPGA